MRHLVFLPLVLSLSCKQQKQPSMRSYSESGPPAQSQQTQPQPQTQTQPQNPAGTQTTSTVLGNTANNEATTTTPGINLAGGYYTSPCVKTGDIKGTEDNMYSQEARSFFDDKTFILTLFQSPEGDCKAVVSAFNVGYAYQIGSAVSDVPNAYAAVFTAVKLLWTVYDENMAEQMEDELGIEFEPGEEVDVTNAPQLKSWMNQHTSLIQVDPGNGSLRFTRPTAPGKSAADISREFTGVIYQKIK
ncbi:MAG: hypothetical protein AB7T49_17425 [Oligoflexales bacterium]